MAVEYHPQLATLVKAPPEGERPAVHGEALFPWCAAVRVDAADLAALKARRPIAQRPLEPPAWALPEGFPDPGAPIRALHGGKLVAIVRERDGMLAPDPALRGPL